MILDETETRARSIGQIDRDSAGTLVHTGAIYIHEGQSFIVNRLDWEHGQAFVTPAHVDYYTEASTTTDVAVENEAQRVEAAATIKSLGEVCITSQTTGFRKIKLYTHETLGWGEIHLPEQEMHTTAYWFCIAPDTADELIARAYCLRPTITVPIGRRFERNSGARRASLSQVRGGRTAGPIARCASHPTVPRVWVRAGCQPERSVGERPGEFDDVVPRLSSSGGSREGMRGALSGLGHVLGEIAPLYLMCDPRDIGVIAEARSAFTELPTITIYDRVPAGIGLSDELFELHDQLLGRRMMWWRAVRARQAVSLSDESAGERSTHRVE